MVLYSDVYKTKAWCAGSSPVFRLCKMEQNKAIATHLLFSHIHISRLFPYSVICKHHYNNELLDFVKEFTMDDIIIYLAKQFEEKE